MRYIDICRQSSHLLEASCPPDAGILEETEPLPPTDAPAEGPKRQWQSVTENVMITCAYMRFEHSLRALLRNKYDENGILGCSDPSGSCSASMFHIQGSQLMITLVICNTYV